MKISPVTNHKNTIKNNKAASFGAFRIRQGSPLVEALHDTPFFTSLSKFFLDNYGSYGAISTDVINSNMEKGFLTFLTEQDLARLNRVDDEKSLIEIVDEFTNSRMITEAKEKTLEPLFTKIIQAKKVIKANAEILAKILGAR